MRRRHLIPSLGAMVATLGIWAGAAVAAPPANTAAPTVTGTPTVGETLTAQNGSWSNSPTAFRYRWQRCDASGGACANIAGAVDKTYLVTNADRGRTMRVLVVASNIEGVSSARSAPTAAVERSDATQNVNPPTIDGVARVGEQLTADVGTWTNSPTSYQYRWLRCDVDGLNCLPIQLGQSKNYQVRAVDVGSRIRVRVLAFNADGIGAALSASSGFVVPSNPVLRERPVLTLLSVTILGNRVYSRFRICDDNPRNLTVFAKDSRPGRGSQLRRFSTLIPPNPCGVYTRSWIPAQKFRTKGRYTVTIQALDSQGLRSPERRKAITLR